ncbi:hypothetical protein BV25DRAFT_1827399 [Artomyces pyxidatus]|uniref:Uncharacterized protein n=1 Tax=Artomyces pyxidatus TaxID=48021 RepID=A0ACB8SWS5_9AGAM|nr:hypothetical protein BV25DRAFT_1827399 [Artomyces pyxidatus]
MPLIDWPSISRLVTRCVLARLFSTFLCCVVIIVQPFSRLGGPSAFLVLTLKELVFAVQDNLAQHVEATILNIMGAMFGIAVSCFGRYLSSLRPDNSASSRAIPAVCLIIIIFTAGWVKSRLPRLQMSARISCFISIWILTTDVGIASLALENATQFLWITFSAAIICLFSSMLLLHWSSTRFADEVAGTFSMLYECLAIGLREAFDFDAHNASEPLPSRQNLLNNLLPRSILLNLTYSQAAFELRVGRLSVKSIKPFIGIVEHTRRELSWGHMNYEHGRDSRIVDAFKGPVLELGHAILASMKAVEASINVVFSVHRAWQAPHVQNTVPHAAQQLLLARDAAREQLRIMFDELDMGQRASSSDFRLSRDLSDYCLFTISLLQMAHEVRNALLVVQDIILIYERSPIRLWLPRLSWAWLGVASPTAILDDRAAPADEPELFEGEIHLSSAEARQGFAECIELEADQQTLKSVDPSIYTIGSSPGLAFRRLFFVQRWWNNRRVLRLRLALSAFFRAFVHSSHLKHAMKNAIGVALLTLPAFFPLDSSVRSWFVKVHGQWMTISYVWVLETNLGATWRVGYLRISGTVLGALYAYITWLICRTNPYGLVAMVTVADVPISWLIINTETPSLGVVASVTLPPIVFPRYLKEDESTPVILLAVWRASMIGAGIIAALAVNTLIFPRRCRVLFLHDTSRTLGLLSQLYLTLGREMFQHSISCDPDARRRTLRLELEIRNALYRLTLLISAMNDELSMLPKPMGQYRNTVTALQAVLDIMTGLRKVRENIPVKETVSAVFRERREFVSCICISLYACEHAFRVRQPLPQFLPSARLALKTLVTQIEDSIRDTRRQDTQALGLSLVYAFAESEMLKDLVDALERLLGICRSLFGTAAWLDERRRPEDTLPMDEVGPHHGWYSTL